MNYTIIECEQRSDEWVAARLGRLTGSRAGDMLATRKDKTEAAGRRNLRTQLVLERITGQPQEDPFESPWMKRGAELEHMPIGLYEAETGIVLERTGFVSGTDLMVGCSLDAHVGRFAGIIEAKCPKAANHLQYLREKRLPPEYVAQLTHDMWLTNAQWADFVSYNDQFPEELQFFVVRVHRVELAIEDYAREVGIFLAEVDREELAVRAMMRRQAA